MSQPDSRPLPALAVWLEEGGEPSEHVLNELTERRAALDALPVRLLFLVPGRPPGTGRPPPAPAAPPSPPGSR